MRDAEVERSQYENSSPQLSLLALFGCHGSLQATALVAGYGAPCTHHHSVDPYIWQTFFPTRPHRGPLVTVDPAASPGCARAMGHAGRARGGNSAFVVPSYSWNWGARERAIWRHQPVP